MKRYPHIAGVLRAVGTWLIGCIFPFIVGAYLGYDRGEDHGRLEMKCAIFGVFDRLGATSDSEAATVGCVKLGRSK